MSRAFVRAVLFASPFFAAAVLAVAACGGSDTEDPGPPDGPLPGTDGPSSDVVSPIADGGDGGDGSSPQGLFTGPRDRVGRPYVSLLLVSPPNREDYNAEPVEMVFPDDPGIDGGTSFGADFQAGLVALDRLDGIDDWGGGNADAGADDAGVYPHPLEDAWLSTDALLVDPNKVFSTTSFLDLEAHPGANTTCGGRWPGEDALDKTMSFLVKKSLTGVTDGVSAPAKAPTQTFPYLAAPF